MNRTENGEHKVPIIEAKNIQKNFGAVRALKNGNFDLLPGEIHAICGGNGAGKSTMVKILSGVYQPDGGTLLMKGRPIHLSSPKSAMETGIHTVHQTLGLIDHLDVTSNLFLGNEIRKKSFLSWFGVLDKKRMREYAISELGRLNIGVRTVDELVAKMSGGQRQAIAVARTLIGKAPVIMLDEPTAALGVRESQDVINLMLKCKEEGIGVVVISHDMDEVFRVADRITIFRLGDTIATVKCKDVSETDVVGMITGAVKGNRETEEMFEYDRGGNV